MSDSTVTHAAQPWVQTCAALYNNYEACRAEKRTSSCASSLNQPSTSGSPAADFSHVTHVAVKAMNVEQGDNAQLAEHEGQVLASLSGKHYVPTFHGYYTDPESQQWHRRAYVLTE